MYFVFSKTLGLLVQPLNLAIALVALWLLLRWRRRAARLRRLLARAALAIVVFFSLPIVAQGLLWPLESAFPASPRLREAPRGIAMLTGMTDIRASGYELTAASDRIVETVRLAHLYPSAKVFLLGGSGSLIDRYQESAVLGRLAVGLGIKKERIVIDINSRNTRENAVEGAKLFARLPAKRGEILLVTSASHMPRAAACFAKTYAGPLEVIPWPVDYQRDAIRHSSFIPRVRALARSTRVINEYVGLVVYWLLGYS